MTHITADTETLLQQAPWTAAEYMRRAVADIDGLFHHGFAQAHPELIGQYMLTCALDLHAGVVARAIESVGNEVEEAAFHLSGISSEIEMIRENMPTGEPDA